MSASVTASVNRAWEIGFASSRAWEIGFGGLSAWEIGFTASP